jgi:carboxypeptidase C (cathepsin A)
MFSEFKKPKKSALAALMLATFLATTFAQESATEPAATKSAVKSAATQSGDAGKIAVTNGQIKIAGADFKYQASAGFMPLKDDAGKLRANVFFTAYAKGGAGEKQDSKRPIMFLFNGGPGAASVWLHLGTAGPKRLDLKEDGTALPPPAKLVDNESTWLAESDLVFVDPVSTGFSRAEGDRAKEFHGYREDIVAMGEFVRLYLTKYERWNSPKFLAGESYGTTRAAGLSDHLQESVGISVNGVILVSTVLDFAVLSPGNGNDVPYPLFLPTYTAAAWQHKKLSPDLQNADLAKTLKEVETFATTDYTAALAKGDRLTDAERAVFVEKLSRYTGLSKAYVEQADLRIHPSRFQKELLRDQKKIIGRFDGRVTGFALDAVNDGAEYDPSLTPYRDGYTEAFNTYVRQTLNFETDLSYEVLTGKVNPWNWGSERGYLYVGDNLRSAMTRNPHLKVLVAQGTYDFATPYFAADYQIAHLGIAKELRGNIKQTYYAGGHMMYHEKKSLEQLGKDVAEFVKAAK